MSIEIQKSNKILSLLKPKKSNKKEGEKNGEGFGGEVSAKRKVMLALNKGFWIVLIGGVIGYFIEVLYFCARTGIIESKQGVLYGPFNPIYGFGALLIVICTYFMRKMGNIMIFVICAVSCNIFEFLCGLFLENALGIKLWQYGQESVTISGRVSLLNMFFWGILGLFFIRVVAPKIMALVDLIMDSSKLKVIPAVLFVVVVFNLIISPIALQREGERLDNQPATTSYQRVIDKYYSQDFMKQIYPEAEHK